MRSRNVWLGTFNSEYFWREKELADLPSIMDGEANRIVGAMDELLFPLCNKEDVLLTRHMFNEALKEYLSDIGFSFQPAVAGLMEDAFPYGEPAAKSTCQLLCENGKKDCFTALLSKCSGVVPYSVLPYLQEFCSFYKLPYNFPSIAIVKKANSKVYSHQLLKELGRESPGEVVYSAGELRESGSRLLMQGSFLIKDDFGVSGKGNLLIKSGRMLEKVATYLEKQEKEGKLVRFLLEPFYENKKLDFSCQLFIRENGEIEYVSVQHLLNSGFAYKGSKVSPKSFIDFITEKQYFNVIDSAAGRLYKEGYRGAVCIDSMLLQDDSIVPVIEINARYSMGFICSSLTKFAATCNTDGMLSFLSLGCPAGISFENILERMKERGLLFDPCKGKGIIPLSANTLTVNRIMQGPPEGQDLYKGRLYVFVCGDTDQMREEIFSELKAALGEMQIAIYD